MKADLERKVHELLDAGRDPVDDAEIRSAIADDEEARAEVAGLSKLESWLRGWEVSVPEEDLEPIAQRIEQRLDEPMGSFDVTAAPEFDDPDAKVSSLGGERGAVRSGEYSLDALAGAVDAPSPVLMTGPSPAVALSAPPRPEKKRKAPIAPWIAAAAVVALGVMVSVATLNTADEPAVSMSAPQAEQAPGMFPAAPSTEPVPSEEPMEMAEAEEADDYAAGPMEEERTEAVADESPTASAAAETTAELGATEGNAGAVRRRTSRGSTMAAMTSGTRAPSILDTATGGAAPPAMAQGAGGAAEDDRQVAVERSKAGVRACLGAGADSAVVMVRFRDGAVRDARLVRPTGNDATNECVAAALRRARIRPEGQQERRTLYYRWGAAPSNAYR